MSNSSSFEQKLKTKLSRNPHLKTKYPQQQGHNYSMGLHSIRLLTVYQDVE
jgi:hypothetical protein